jgi:chorismate mutase / prephenate dehydratase
MAASGRTLDALRREIDRIDDEIHDDLMRRAAVVDEIRHSKGADAGSYLRPGREAAILRRLLARHSGNLPKASLVRIWREVMAAVAQLQGPFGVAVFAPADYPGYWDLARDHFGSATPMTRYASVDHVIRAAGEDRNTIAVLPYPHEASADPWWRFLASEDEGALRVVARLPFFPVPGRGDNISALAVARMDAEETGRDRTLFAVETANEVSRSHFNSALKTAGFDPRFVGEWTRVEKGFLHIVEIAGFVAPSDPRFERLREWQEGAITSIIPVGGYAEPLGEDEIAESIARRA